MPGATEVQYLVLPDATNPYLLARVRWPDVFQAISAARPDWQDDVGLFDLPYDPSSTRVTLDQAAALAVSWGARLPPDEPDEQAQMPEWALIRRMPASWSNLSPADKRAWSLDSAKTGRRATAEKNSTNNGGVGTTVSWLARLRRSDAVSPPPQRSERVNEGVTSDRGAAPNADEADEQAPMSEGALIRRMPASRSNLSPADKRAWSLDSAKTGRRATAEKDGTNNGGVRTTVSWLGRLRRSDAVSPPPQQSERVNEGVTSDLDPAPNDAPDREEGGNPALASIGVTAFESGDGVRKERVRPPAPTAKLVITTRKGRPPGVDR
jgi:hypothetical protein